MLVKVSSPSQIGNVCLYAFLLLSLTTCVVLILICVFGGGRGYVIVYLSIIFKELNNVSIQHVLFLYVVLFYYNIVLYINYCLRHIFLPPPSLPSLSPFLLGFTYTLIYFYIRLFWMLQMAALSDQEIPDLKTQLASVTGKLEKLSTKIGEVCFHQLC